MKDMEAWIKNVESYCEKSKYDPWLNDSNGRYREDLPKALRIIKAALYFRDGIEQTNIVSQTVGDYSDNLKMDLEKFKKAIEEI